MQSRELDPSPFGRPALLRMPDPGIDVRGGVVALHGAGLPQRRQPLFEHLAITLTPMGFAVLTFDRRSGREDEDTPFDIQAEDALAAVEHLRTTIDAPVGQYGYSQGGRPEPTVVTIAGCGHFPAPDGDPNSLSVPVAGFSPAYTIALRRWFAER